MTTANKVIDKNNSAMPCNHHKCSECAKHISRDQIYYETSLHLNLHIQKEEKKGIISRLLSFLW